MAKARLTLEMGAFTQVNNFDKLLIFIVDIKVPIISTYGIIMLEEYYLGP